ncbi:MAG: DUF4422 domain-containing protein [Clostridiales bacterium]|nr:DUF4422 domain-containing protein [Clostridiales bacterium]
MDRNEVKVAVATHKPYHFPGDEAYLPVHAGAAQSAPLEYQSDAEGENISQRNPNYCELTVLYWAWKNLPSDALGLAHYRRYLAHDGKPLTAARMAKLLEQTPVLLPKKRHYWIETNESQYVHAHGAESLNALKEVISDCAPEYLDAFQQSLGRRSGHRFNMFIMRREVADAYCQWLFGLLFELQRRIGGTPVEIPRLYGFLSERMLDCWLDVGGYAWQELPVYATEKTNWIRKGFAFLKRKFFSGTRKS